MQPKRIRKHHHHFSWLIHRINCVSEEKISNDVLLTHCFMLWVLQVCDKHFSLIVEDYVCVGVGSKIFASWRGVQQKWHSCCYVIYILLKLLWLWHGGNIWTCVVYDFNLILQEAIKFTKGQWMDRQAKKKTGPAFPKSLARKPMQRNLWRLN